MLASTVQFSTNNQDNHQPHHQTPAPRPPPPQQGRPPRANRSGGTDSPSHSRKTRHPPPKSRGARSLRTQQRASTTAPRPGRLSTPRRAVLEPPDHQGRQRQSIDVPPIAKPRAPHSGAPRGRRPAPGRTRHRSLMLLRKEVIQPHLPVRLPCYDLVPITSPTFDSS